MTGAEDVRFFSEGERIEALLFRVPPGAADLSPRPAIVLCHGFTALKEMVLPEIAVRLAAEGWSAVIPDYRYFGASGGLPRRRLLPLAQVADVRSAITYVSQLPGVDPQRIGLFGTSFGGAIVSHVAAVDGARDAR